MRLLPYALIFSLPLSFCLVAGWQLEHTDHVTPGLPGVAFFLLSALLLTPVSLFLLSWKPRKPLFFLHPVPPADKKAGRRMFLLTWAAIALLNLIVLLGVYPGFFVYDAQDELTEVLSRTFNTHHPLLHVLALGGTVTGIHKITGDWNLGIFIYLLLQMLLITGIFALVIRRLADSGLPKPLRITAILWYGVFPTIVMGTLCSSKDGLFTAFTTLFFLELVEQRHSRRRSITLLVSCSAMMLFRNNARYALLVFALCLLVFWGISQIRRAGKADTKDGRAGSSAPLFLISIVIISFVILSLTNTLLIRATHATSNEHQESIPVVIQTLARAWHDHPEAFSDEDREALISYLGEEGLERYELRNADLVKMYFNNGRYETDSGSFWALWFRILRRCPDSYLNGWFLLSYPMWYPFAVNNVYEGHTVFTFTYTESSYFGYETELPGTRQSLIPPIDALYRWLSLDATIQRIPVLSLFFAPAFYFWLYLFLALRLLAQKRSGDAFPLLPILLLWLTYLIGPAAVVRYALLLWTILPIVLTGFIPSEEQTESGICH